MRLARFACWLGLLLAATLSAQAAVEKRVALVIGNGAYKNTIELPNAPNDARAIAGKLRQLGFTVVEGVDLTQAGMTDKLKEFSRTLANADVGLFFYAGHGLQVAGENYLVPVDAALRQERDLDFETLKVDLVLKQLLREAKVKLVILDACRDNPLTQELARSMSGSSRSRSLGLASGLGAIDTQNATGSMIAFATAPGTVALDGTGRNSPFTEALLAHIDTPGIDINVMMTRVRGQVTRATSDRQQPWTNSSLTAEFFLNPTSAGQTQAGAQGQVVAAVPSGDASNARGLSGGFDPAQAELQFWQDARSMNTVSAYRAYLDQYPSGRYAGLAREQISVMTSSSNRPATSAPSGASGNSTELRSAEASSTTEDTLRLAEDDWRSIQKKLSALGFGTRGIDGEAGRGTRQAIKDWQTARGYTVSGYLNKPQHEALLSETAAKKSASSADDDEKPRARSTSRGQSSSEAPARRSSSGSAGSGSGAEAAGRFVGGVARGLIGGRLGF